MPRHVEPPVGVGGPVGGGGAELRARDRRAARLDPTGRKTTAAATAANHPGMRMTARARSATRIMRYWSHDQPVSRPVCREGLTAWPAAFSAAAAAVAAGTLWTRPQVVAAAPPAPLAADPPGGAGPGGVPPDDPVDAATNGTPGRCHGDPGVRGVGGRRPTGARGALGRTLLVTGRRIGSGLGQRFDARGVKVGLLQLWMLMFWTTAPGILAIWGKLASTRLMGIGE